MTEWGANAQGEFSGEKDCQSHTPTRAFGAKRIQARGGRRAKTTPPGWSQCRKTKKPGGRGERKAKKHGTKTKITQEEKGQR